MHAPKNGFFYVLDRQTGKVISANNFVPVNWATLRRRRDGASGDHGERVLRRRPVLRDADRRRRAQLVAVVVQPATGLVYFQAQETSLRYAASGLEVRAGRLQPRPGPAAGSRARRREEAYRPRSSTCSPGIPVENKERCRVDARGGGVLATGADLVFQGRGIIDGELVAIDAASGEQVWSYPMPNAAAAAPISYSVDGEQYIAINTGARATGNQLAALDTQARARAGTARRVQARRHRYAAAAPRSAPPPNPPTETFADDVVRAGELLYADYCGRCHGNATRSINVIPDMRRSPALTRARSCGTAIVIDGEVSGSRNDRLDALISATQAESIRAYVGRQAVVLRDELAAAPPNAAAGAAALR